MKESKLTFQQYHEHVKEFGSRPRLHLVSSDLGPSCLQRLSVYDTSMQRGLCSKHLLEMFLFVFRHM